MVSHNVSATTSFPCLNRYAKSCVNNQFVGFLKEDMLSNDLYLFSIVFISIRDYIANIETSLLL